MSDKDTTISQVRGWVKEFRRKRGWWPDWNVKSNAISLVIEATEFLEHFQWSEADEVIKKQKTKLADELADVLYWVVVLADGLELDLADSLRNKLRKGDKKYPAKLFQKGHKENLKVYYKLRDKHRKR